MSRYRPPSPPKTALITPKGYTKLKDELDYLWKVKRPEVTKKVSEAAAQGDRSENAEYIYGKKQLREIDRRVRYLSKRLDNIKVVSEPPSDQSMIFFGATITIENEDGHEKTFKIVGPDEIGTESHFISIDSPMARALLKKRVDDEVRVQTPAGGSLVYVVGIGYEIE